MKIWHKDIWKYAVIKNWEETFILWKIVKVWWYQTLEDDWVVTLTRDICWETETFIVNEKYILFKFFEEGIVIEQ